MIPAPIQMILAHIQMIRAYIQMIRAHIQMIRARPCVGECEADVETNAKAMSMM